MEATNRPNRGFVSLGESKSETNETCFRRLHFQLGGRAGSELPSGS